MEVSLLKFLWLAAAMGWLAVGCLQGAEFSHRTHLGLKIACVTCHTAAQTSRSAEDHLLPALSACTGCHAEGRAVRTTPSEYFVKKFSHAAHVQMLNCEGCHRLVEQAANPGFPKMAFCIGCHNKIDMTDSCMKCHLPEQALKPATHTAGFYENHSGPGIPKTGCAVCHGRRFTCQGCH